MSSFRKAQIHPGSSSSWSRDSITQAVRRSGLTVNLVSSKDSNPSFTDLDMSSLDVSPQCSARYALGSNGDHDLIDEPTNGLPNTNPETETNGVSFSCDLDMDSVERTFNALMSLPNKPIVTALVGSVNVLCENLMLDLKYHDIYDKNPDIVNVFAILMLVPVLETSEYFENCFEKFCKAAAQLPLKGRARLVKLLTHCRVDVLRKMVQAVQHLLSVLILTRSYGPNHSLQDDPSLCAAAKLLSYLFYASILGGVEREPPETPPGHGNDAMTKSNAELFAAKEQLYDFALSGSSEESLKELLSMKSLDIRNPLLPFEDFYNEVLSQNIRMENDFINFMRRRGDEEERFSFIREAPFLLTPACKVEALYYDTRVRMHSQRTESLYAALFDGAITDPYLKLSVNRESVVQDALLSLEFVAKESPQDLKKQLYVEFVGEQGVDEGGLSKEFYQLVTQHLFNPDYGMWILHEDTRLYWFSPQDVVSHEEYYLIGILFGLAIYNNIIVDVQFPMVLYRKLKGKQGTLEDLKDVDPTLYRSLKDLLNYDGLDVADVFCLTFQISYQDVFGHVHTHNLKPNGDSIFVDSYNREEFVKLYVDYLLNEAVDEQFRSFWKGFHEVTNESILCKLFRAEEIEQLVCGSQNFDFNALEQATIYENGLRKQDDLVKWFWEIVHDLSEEDKKCLLQFATGSDRVPVGGLADIKFMIAKNGPDSDRLPTAHTCFNVLLLPSYSSKEKLKDRLLKAIKNSKGFGLQ